MNNKILKEKILNLLTRSGHGFNLDDNYFYDYHKYIDGVLKTTIHSEWSTKKEKEEAQKVFDALDFKLLVIGIIFSELLDVILVELREEKHAHLREKWM